MVFKRRVARFAMRRWTSTASKATVVAVPEWATCVGSFRTSTPAQVRTTARDYSRRQKTSAAEARAARAGSAVDLLSLTHTGPCRRFPPKQFASLPVGRWAPKNQGRSLRRIDYQEPVP